MAPRGRPKPGMSRMDAAVDAMKPLGFDKKVVTAKMRKLVKEYDGHYGFIESDAYIVLLEALLEDKDKENSLKEIERGETSKRNEIVEGVQVEKSHAIVPTVGLVDIPTPPPSPLSLDVFQPPLPPALEAPLTEPVLDAALQLPPPPALEAPPPPPPPPVLYAGQPLPPATPAMYTVPPPPGFAHQFRRKRKPCYGWIADDDEEPQFIRLPSSADGKISPPKQRSSLNLKHEEM